MINKPVKVLIIGQVWPEPTSSAAGTRMLQLINLFLEYNWKVVFVSTAATGEHSADLPTEVDRASILLNSTTFDNQIKDINPDVVIFDRFMVEEQFGWRVANICPHALRILNTEDLHCLRSVRQQQYKKDDAFAIDQLLTEDITKREMASIYRCDLTLSVSTFEMSLLQNTFKVDKSLLMYIPVFAGKRFGDSPAFEQRKDFIFVGNFLHQPNKDAVKYLRTQLWPKIHEALPIAAMQVYGAYTTSDIKQLHSPKINFHVNGRAEDSHDVVAKGRLVLAPLKYGAGIKGKLLEAMVCGTPSVTTEIGAEGFNYDGTWPGAITFDDAEFVAFAIDLYSNATRWKIAQQCGFRIAESNYDVRHFQESFRDMIKNLLENLEAHRKLNFIGAMLQHHTMRSTEFLARWIEEKNK